MTSQSEVALKILRNLPRMDLQFLSRSPYKYKKKRNIMWFKWINKEDINRNVWRAMSHCRYAPIGFNDGFTPFWMQTPQEYYYKNFDTRRQYPPVTLQQLQLMIDTALIDTQRPIDLATIYGTNHYRRFVPAHNHFGVRLTEEGMDRFTAKVNIEVSHASEAVIAAVERNGGRITTAYYDMASVLALHQPWKFFRAGEAIPKRLLPPEDAIDYYTDARNRGYLADEAEIERDRFVLAQKYGYTLADMDKDPNKDMLTLRKHKRQIFYGLEPGWVVNMRDREILEPSDELLREYYTLASNN